MADSRGTATYLEGWGRFPRLPGRRYRPRPGPDLAGQMPGCRAIARGNGRAYGDSAIGVAATLEMRRFDRMLAFDPATGQLVAEAGVLLGDVIAAFLARGWFPAVTPGTKFVTLGGAIAADVHGKNHHVHGSFGACVDWIDLADADGAVRRCSRTENADLFAWTVGGMGLTGVILRAAIRLLKVDSAWIRQTTLPAPDLGRAIATFEDNAAATYSVAWIDCLARGGELGRSLVMLGEHAGVEDLDPDRRRAPFEVPRKRRVRMPLDAPGWALNGMTVRAFNRLYWRRGRAGAGTRLVDWDSYFYPLDAILGWNRIYGGRGFAQFQCVLPLDRSETGLRALLEAISAAGQGSFLAVLKRFGAQDSPISFPMEGYTLALDFPATPRALALMDRLDRITLDHGGRFYLAKDSRMAQATLHASDPRVADFTSMRRETGLRAHFASAQSERLDL